MEKHLAPGPDLPLGRDQWEVGSENKEDRCQGSQRRCLALLHNNLVLPFSKKQNKTKSKEYLFSVFKIPLSYYTWDKVDYIGIM